MKALSLLSGGLDSMLAVKLLLEQGIEVIGINFATPFFGPSRAEIAAEHLGIQLRVVDITDPHLGVIRKPKYGYGRFVNPCIDCHALMIKETGRLMEQLGAQFIATGEVLGQRPKSQNLTALKQVEEESGYRGFVLRPLSAKLLPPTIPEERGWVNRDQLLDISGRSRKRQMELAKQYGLNDYPTPAGGCLLTEQVFSNRLKDIMGKDRPWDVNDVELLKLGRHFRFSDGTKLVVGRNQMDNDTLEKLASPEDFLISATVHKGPMAILRGPQDDRIKHLGQAAAIVARYGKGKDQSQVEIRYHSPGEDGDTVIVKPATDEEVQKFFI